VARTRSKLKTPVEPNRESILRDASRRSLLYLEALGERRVAPTAEEIQALDTLAEPLPTLGCSPVEVLRSLDDVGSRATVATAGGRYFGFVIGSGNPTGLAANWLAAAWNQNVAMRSMSPTAARLEEIAVSWTRELLRLPAGCEGAFVSGDTMANFTGLAAARHAVLAKVGWDVEERGLSGAPPIALIVGEEVHVSALRAISLLGLGRGRLHRVPVDAQGRIRADSLPPITGPTIVCTQAGNVNSGAFDPLGEICPVAHRAGAWVHVDGAFGLWAAAAPRRRHLTEGVPLADSWATDCHKWLNVPYDSGLVFVRDPEHLRSAMSVGPAAYLPPSGEREPFEFTPEMSRRARGVDAWATLRSLGRAGVADLVERTCGFATQFAEGLTRAGYEILNEVVLNQVLVSFGDDRTTDRVVAGIQADGTCWCGGTRWHGRTAMRISVSSWATTQADVDRSLSAMLRIAKSAQLPRASGRLPAPRRR
jgi:glutamate/tyrosine decarboxylase-like PLP-dependent enzyme